MSDVSDAKAAVLSWVGMFKGLEKAVGVLSALEGADAALALKKSALAKAEAEFERLAGKRGLLDAELAAKRDENAVELSRLKEDLRSRRDAASEEFRKELASLAEQTSAARADFLSAEEGLRNAKAELFAATAELGSIRAEVNALKKKFA